MKSNKPWEAVSRVSDNAEVALWALLLTSVIFFFAFVVPKLPEISAQNVRIRAEEIATENAYYCEKLGMKAGTQKHSQCLLDLGEFRLKVEKRITDESFF